MIAKSVRELYSDELQQICSANAQMLSAITRMAEKCMDSRLMQGLQKTAKGIARHGVEIEILLNAETGAAGDQRHSLGMAGLVDQALQHIGDDATTSGELFDLVIVAHYQKMSYFGIASFRTAAAYAKALDETHAAEQITQMTREIQEALEFSSRFAEPAQIAAAISDANR